MSKNSRFERLDLLVARLLDGQATAEDAAELERLLVNSEEDRRRYVHYCDIHLELPEALVEAEFSQQRPTFEAGNQQTRWWRHLRTYAVVAAAAMLFGVWLAAKPFREPDAGNISAAQSVTPSPVVFEERTIDSIATLTQAEDVEWLTEQAPLVGGALSPGRLQFAQGLIQIEFYRGARMVVEGPADVELLTVNQAICRQGRLSASVPMQARGFTVNAPDLKLVDLGTEFGMNVLPGQSTEVYVIDGEVELMSRDNKTPSGTPTRVVEGHVARIAEGGKILARHAGEGDTEFPWVARQFRDVGSVASFRRWETHISNIRNDPRVVALYAFEPQETDLRILKNVHTSSPASDGMIIGCNWRSGRWPNKSALEFRHSRDRVRIEIQREFDALSLTAWVRVDALEKRSMGLLLTDGYEHGEPHWQINSEGQVRLGFRLPDDQDTPPGLINTTGYASPVVFDSHRLGVWTFLATIFDRAGHRVEHWVDGELVSRHEEQYGKHLGIRSAEIGNWGVPFDLDQHPIRNLNGVIDELAIWDVALDADDLKSLYQNGRPR